MLAGLGLDGFFGTVPEDKVELDEGEGVAKGGVAEGALVEEFDH